MRHTVSIDNLVAGGFADIPLAQTPYVLFAREFLEGAVAADSGYFHWLNSRLAARGKVWGYIETPADCLQRAEKFRELVLDIHENGYRENYEIHFNERGIGYGPITVEPVAGPYYRIKDGHHRAATLVAVGYTEIVVDAYQKLYQDSFPPATKLQHLQFDWTDKSVIDIGCNLGMLSKYVFSRGASAYCGYDANHENIAEGRSRFPGVDLRVGPAATDTGASDVLCCLGVFHHMSDELIRSLLERFVSRWIIFENPLGSEPFKNYAMRPLAWYLEAIGIQSVREAQYGFGYPVDRRIIICERTPQHAAA